MQILRNNALISLQSLDKSSLFCQLVYGSYAVRVFGNVVVVYRNVALNIAFCMAVLNRVFSFFTRNAKFFQTCF